VREGGGDDEWEDGSGDSCPGLASSVSFLENDDDKPTHMIPNANPNFRTNHSSRNNRVGAYAKEPPIPYRMPWVRINVGTLLAKLLATSARHIVASPTGRHQYLIVGTRSRA
jgi:hypothetical protein